MAHPAACLPASRTRCPQARASEPGGKWVSPSVHGTGRTPWRSWGAASSSPAGRLVGAGGEALAGRCGVLAGCRRRAGGSHEERPHTSPTERAGSLGAAVGTTAGVGVGTTAGVGVGISTASGGAGAGARDRSGALGLAGLVGGRGDGLEASSFCTLPARGERLERFHARQASHRHPLCL